MATVAKEKEKLKHRETELQAILRKLYEDNALGKISDEQFMALSKDFTAEQKQNKERPSMQILTSYQDKDAKIGHKTADTSFFKCKECSQRDGCYKEGAKKKTYSVVNASLFC